MYCADENTLRWLVYSHDVRRRRDPAQPINVIAVRGYWQDAGSAAQGFGRRFRLPEKEEPGSCNGSKLDVEVECRPLCAEKRRLEQRSRE